MFYADQKEIFSLCCVIAASGRFREKLRYVRAHYWQLPTLPSPGSGAGKSYDKENSENMTINSLLF